VTGRRRRPSPGECCGTGTRNENSYAWFAQIDGDQVKNLRSTMDTSYAFKISKPKPGQRTDDEHVAEQLRRLWGARSLPGL